MGSFNSIYQTHCNRLVEPKMAAVLHVYKEVEIVNAELVQGTLKEPRVVTISYDEKPDIQGLATTTPDLPPAPNQFPSHLRDYECKRRSEIGQSRVREKMARLARFAKLR
jgi:hypothetical protein